ncbi:hypothetical protein EVAR_61301_1 [Eumeta japonica]|uniref:Uncharacterized protein n=1 Tax=Eumeta variegata TaxID=151549 RepID=A0A4C1XHY6_EUMVA|nr:hypothetical protein EVAR_61301_1 [Eumeta japonica]
MMSYRIRIQFTSVSRNPNNAILKRRSKCQPFDLRNRRLNKADRATPEDLSGFRWRKYIYESVYYRTCFFAVLLDNVISLFSDVIPHHSASKYRPVMAMVEAFTFNLQSSKSRPALNSRSAGRRLADNGRALPNNGALWKRALVVRRRHANGKCNRRSVETAPVMYLRAEVTRVGYHLGSADLEQARAIGTADAFHLMLYCTISNTDTARKNRKELYDVGCRRMKRIPIEPTNSETDDLSVP